MKTLKVIIVILALTMPNLSFADNKDWDSGIHDLAPTGIVEDGYDRKAHPAEVELARASIEQVLKEAHVSSVRDYYSLYRSKNEPTDAEKATQQRLELRAKAIAKIAYALRTTASTQQLSDDEIKAARTLYNQALSERTEGEIGTAVFTRDVLTGSVQGMIREEPSYHKLSSGSRIPLHKGLSDHVMDIQYGIGRNANGDPRHIGASGK